MLLCRLLIFIWDDKVVDDALDRSILIVEVALVLLYAFLTSKEHEAVTQVLILSIGWRPQCVSLHIIIVNIDWRSWVSPLRLVAHQSQCIDLDLFAFDQSC